jgi:hypothetical protein
LNEVDGEQPRAVDAAEVRYREEPMFGRIKARNLNQAAQAAYEAERTVRIAKAARVRGRQLAKEESDKNAERMSPAEKTRAQRNSLAEQMKSTPAV